MGSSFLVHFLLICLLVSHWHQIVSSHSQHAAYQGVGKKVFMQSVDHEQWQRQRGMVSSAMLILLGC